MISEENIKTVARLARLKLKDEEVKLFSSQLKDILKYVEILNEVDTSNVDESSQVTGLENVSEKDEIKTKSDPEKLILCSPLPKERKQIRVKPVITEN